MNLSGSSTVVVDDCRKSQTLDSLPGKAGGLPILIKGVSSGDRYAVTKSFSLAFENLLSSGLIVKYEAPVKSYIEIPSNDIALQKLLLRKRVDYAIEGKNSVLPTIKFFYSSISLFCITSLPYP